MKIHTEFFQGENKYRNGNGDINRHILRDDYRKFLTANGIPWEYSWDELIAAADAYKGPIEQEAWVKQLKEEHDFYVGLINAQSWD